MKLWSVYLMAVWLSSVHAWDTWDHHFLNRHFFFIAKPECMFMSINLRVIVSKAELQIWQKKCWKNTWLGRIRLHVLPISFSLEQWKPGRTFPRHSIRFQMIERVRKVKSMIHFALVWESRQVSHCISGTDLVMLCLPDPMHWAENLHKVFVVYKLITFRIIKHFA